MKNSVISLAAVLTLFAIPASALAACAAPSGTTLNNPLLYCTITDFVAKALQAMVMIAIPVIGFFIVAVGFQFIWAQGKPDALGKAKKNFLYVIIGAALVLGAWVLATLIGATVSQLVG